MSESRSFNGKDFIESDWTPEDVTEESSYAYNRWQAEQRRQQIAAGAKDQERFDNMTLEEITNEWRQGVAAEEERKRPEREYWAARQVMAERPDYIPTPKNGQRIEEYVKAAKLDSTNPDHLHQAIKALESRGLLQLDPNKIPVAPREQYTEEQLYSMPWDDLEKLARRR
jgi:hypothetical protein